MCSLSVQIDPRQLSVREAGAFASENLRASRGLVWLIFDEWFKCAFLLFSFCLWLPPFCSVTGCPCLSCVRRYVPGALPSCSFLSRSLSPFMCVRLRCVAAIHLTRVALDLLGELPVGRSECDSLTRAGRSGQVPAFLRLDRKRMGMSPGNGPAPVWGRGSSERAGGSSTRPACSRPSD